MQHTNKIDEKDKIYRHEVRRRKRNKIRRRKLLIRNTCIAVIILILAVIGIKGIFIKKSHHQSAEEQYTTTEKKETTEVTENKATGPIEYTIGIPQKRTKKETIAQIKMFAEKDEIMAEIYKNRKLYPSNLLKAVVNNPEMKEFVYGYLEADNKATGGFTKKERKEKHPLLIQWDKRWAYVPYGEDNIGISGCGPTCLSMVILSLTGNKEATPDKIAEYSMNNGYYVEGTGTAWALMSDISQEYGLLSYQIPMNEESMMHELDLGRMLICSVGPGDFTTGGHFIVIYGYDEEGFCINDPYCKDRSKKKWTFETLYGQVKAIWTYRSEN